MRKKHWPENVVVEMKAKVKDLERLFPKEKYIFIVFVRYFLERLEREVTPRAVLDTFAIVVSEMYFVPYPDTRVIMPTVLRGLDTRERERFYRKFPSIMWSLAPGVFAAQAVWEYEAFNRRVKQQKQANVRWKKKQKI